MKTGKRHVISLLNELGIRPSKRLGQNFLVDPNLIGKMVRLGDVATGTQVLEIGAGLGDVTAALLNKGAEVTAVELDRRLCAYLRTIFEEYNTFRLVPGDACQLDYDRLFGDRRYRTISSLPYSAASPILGRFLGIQRPPEVMVVLLQREVGERAAAAPADANKAYASLSVRLQHAYNVRIESYTPPEVFYPSPQVRSALVRLTAKQPFPSQQQRLQLKEVCNVAFSQRRKKVMPVLARQYGEDRVKNAFTQLGLPDNVRAEMIDPDTFQTLASHLV